MEKCIFVAFVLLSVPPQHTHFHNLMSKKKIDQQDTLNLILSSRSSVTRLYGPVSSGTI